MFSWLLLLLVAGKEDDTTHRAHHTKQAMTLIATGHVLGWMDGRGSLASRNKTAWKRSIAFKYTFIGVLTIRSIWLVSGTSIK